MVISCSTCQKEEKYALGLNMGFTESCRNFNFVVIYAIFPAKPYFHTFRIDNKIAYCNSGSVVVAVAVGDR